MSRALRTMLEAFAIIIGVAAFAAPVLVLLSLKG